MGETHKCLQNQMINYVFIVYMSIAESECNLGNCLYGEDYCVSERGCLYGCQPGYSGQHCDRTCSSGYNMIFNSFLKIIFIE